MAIKNLHLIAKYFTKELRYSQYINRTEYVQIECASFFDKNKNLELKKNVNSYICTNTR